MEIEVLFGLLFIIAVVYIKNFLVLLQDGGKLVYISTHVKLRTVYENNWLLI